MKTRNPFTLKNRFAISSLMATSSLVATCLFVFNGLKGQVCSDPINTIYGIKNGDGFIYPINAITANVSATISPAYSGNAPSAANALGYSTNGKFYYFKRNINSSPQEFVSFNPSTNAVTLLANSPCTNNVNSGCANFNGSGYYCLDSDGHLCYYSIASNSWVTITSTFHDQIGTDISSVFPAHPSGDMAVDGLGNLWIVCSSSSQYGLYKISTPLPTTTVASVTATQVLPYTTPTPSGVVFAGIAFNNTGQIFMSTPNQLYRLENNLALTNLGAFSNPGAGADLTSCNFPLVILPVSWKSFSAETETDNNVLLTWVLDQQINSKVYFIEHSTDGSAWQDIGSVENTGDNIGAGNYSFIHVDPADGKNYYRIRQLDGNNNSNYSEVRAVSIAGSGRIRVWPNPAKDIICIRNTGYSGSVRIIDLRGRALIESPLRAGVNKISVESLSPDVCYIVRVELPNGESFNQRFIRQ